MKVYSVIKFSDVSEAVYPAEHNGRSEEDLVKMMFLGWLEHICSVRLGICRPMANLR